MNYPERMTTKTERGDLIVWVKDYGHKGAYQPMGDPHPADQAVTHTNRAARRIRHAYAHECSHPAKKRVLCVGGEVDGVNWMRVDEDQQSIAADMAMATTFR